MGETWSPAGANREKGLELLLIVTHFNGAKGKRAAASLGTSFQMLTIPVECPLSDIASDLQSAGATDTCFPGYE